VIGVDGAGGEGEPRRPGRFRHPGQGPEVAGVLEPVEVEIGRPRSHRQALHPGTRQAGDGQEALRRVGVGELGEELGGDFQGGYREAAAEGGALGGGEEHGGREHGFQP
jgi:hypothetical protein